MKDVITQKPSISKAMFVLHVVMCFVN
jgi:hypothetical protein